MAEALTLSLLIGISVGVSAGYLGSLMVLKKMALVGDALSHVALPGLALGILFNFNPFFGAFAFLFASAVIIWHLGRVTKLPFETIVGAMFTVALAVGILLIPEPDLLEALFGDITKVTILETVVAVVISVMAVLLTKMIYRKLVLGMISEELAISKGIDVSRTNLLYLLLVSLVVAVGIKIVGTLLVGFLVIVPAAAAKNVSADLSKYAVLSASFGTVSTCSGILFSSYLNLPTGPLVVFSGIIVFLATVLVKWKAE
ncbi:ABC transporter [Candidatus Bathyarchaeota archaeon CG07_land_8_20_14_0_80_47_9]|nr:MAG: ABC transporter [Candidatus Bathyarchaeota archaeon CG07_land_8_20_14_0_80_47_9]